MLSPLVADGLTTAIQYWRDKADTLRNELEVADQNVAHLEASLSLCSELTESKATSFGIHSHIEPGDLAGAQTHKQALEKIARLSGGRIKLADAARLIYSSGLSTAAKPSNVKSSLFAQLSTDDDWESEGERTGMYRLIAYFEDQEVKMPEEPDAQSEPIRFDWAGRRLSRDSPYATKSS